MFSHLTVCPMSMFSHLTVWPYPISMFSHLTVWPMAHVHVLTLKCTTHVHVLTLSVRPLSHCGDPDQENDFQLCGWRNINVSQLTAVIEKRERFVILTCAVYEHNTAICGWPRVAYEYWKCVCSSAWEKNMFSNVVVMEDSGNNNCSVCVCRMNSVWWSIFHRVTGQSINQLYTCHCFHIRYPLPWKIDREECVFDNYLQ